jgi:hypothetical protein
MAKIYKTRIQKSFVKSMGQTAMKNAAYKVAQKRMQEAKENVVERFESHPVTLEVEGGPTASNLSGTLGGYGNLFSYIGFSVGENPTEPLRQYLNKRPRVYKTSKFIKRSKSGEWVFRMELPTTSDMETLAGSPWEGRSWIRGVEKGISGLGYYLYSRKGLLSGSRSGTGIQQDSKIRSMPFKPITYMSSILAKFKKELNIR